MALQILVVAAFSPALSFEGLAQSNEAIATMASLLS